MLLKLIITKSRNNELRDYNIIVKETFRLWPHVKGALYMAENRPETLIEFAVVTKGSGDVTGLQTGIHTCRTRHRFQANFTKNKDRFLWRPPFPPALLPICLLFCDILPATKPFVWFSLNSAGRPLQNLKSKCKLSEHRLNFSRTFRKMIKYSLGLLSICCDRFWMKFGTYGISERNGVHKIKVSWQLVQCKINFA